MPKKAIVHPDLKVVTAALKRVMPLVKKFPKGLQQKEADIKVAALEGVAVAHRTKTSEETGDWCVFGGDVVIDGSFAIGCVCIVLGDLTVRDAITASELETYLVVGGSVRARGMICRGQLRVAGAVETEVAFVETSSVLEAKSIAASLVIRESDASEVIGKVKAKTNIELTYPEPEGLEKLKRVLHPKAFGTITGVDNLFDFTNLEGALRRGKPWRAA